MVLGGIASLVERATACPARPTRADLIIWRCCFGPGVFGVDPLNVKRPVTKCRIENCPSQLQGQHGEECAFARRICCGVMVGVVMDFESLGSMQMGQGAHCYKSGAH